MPDVRKDRPPVPSNTGNSRVTVAFPFSKIEIRDPEPALTDLAVLMRDVAVQLAALTHDVDAKHADAADRLVERAKELATSLGAH
jgi:hypothetical protein